jgi:hypothetical protein
LLAQALHDLVALATKTAKTRSSCRLLVAGQTWDRPLLKNWAELTRARFEEARPPISESTGTD